MSLQSDAIFAAIKDRVQADPAKAKTVNGVFLYKITENGKVKKEWSKFKFLAFNSLFCVLSFKGQVT